MDVQWSLVIYSLFLGIAVGPFLVTALTGCRDAHPAVCRWGSAIALGSMIVAGIAAFAHLGHPEHVVYVLTNPASPMARETLVTVITGLIAVVFAAQMFYGLWPQGRRLVAWLGLAGTVLSILVVGTTYMVPARPAWDNWLLPLTFLASSLAVSLPAMIVVAAFTPREVQEEDRGPVLSTLGQWTLTALIAYGVVALVYFVLAGSRPGEGNRVLVGDLAIPFWLGLIVIGVLLPIGLAVRSRSALATSPAARNMMAAAFVLVLAGGIVARAMVFALGTRVPLLPLG